MTVKQTLTFSQFLSRTPSQKDVSLIVAHTATEYKVFEKALTSQGFERAKTIGELFSRVKMSKRVYVPIDKETISKDFYDFIAQYPTGQVEIWDTKKMKSEVIHPVYSNTAVVFLISKQDLSKIEKSGFSMLTYAGLTHQN